MRHILLAAVAILLAGSSSRNKAKPASQLPRQTPAQPTESYEPVEAETRAEMVNVNIHLDGELVLHIRYLTGESLSTRRGQPPTFDDKLSYVVAIDSGTLSQLRLERHPPLLTRILTRESGILPAEYSSVGTTGWRTTTALKVPDTVS